MNYLIIVLRLVHVISGAFWVGAALVFFFFIGPTIGATAESGQKFAQHLIMRTRFTTALASAGGLTVLAGLILYWLDSNGLTSAWMHSGPGVGFALGGVFGIIGLIFGGMVGTTNGRMAKLGSQIQGKPTSEQLSQIQAFQKQLAVIAPINTYALLLALLCMSVARYLSF
ncbi:MAG TPA: hypothetical protein VMT73_02460 [Anaerolineales bacterium]|nr:hypothetical protein [Anaerolineales bacterium]